MKKTKLLVGQVRQARSGTSFIIKEKRNDVFFWIWTNEYKSSGILDTKREYILISNIFVGEL